MVYGRNGSGELKIEKRWVLLNVWEWKALYENGQLWYEGSYDKDRKNGVWKVYHKNGKLAFEGAYTLDEPVGIWKEWDENGNLTREGPYKSNEQAWKKWEEIGIPKHRHPEPIRQAQDKLRRRDWDPYRINKVLKDLIHHIYNE